MTARILYVEDDPDARELVTTLLEGDGYAVESAIRAEEALEKLRRTRFDLLITDYSLPDRDGAWLLREAATRGSLPAHTLIVSAHPSEGIDRPAGVALIRKPIDIDDFLRVVHKELAAVVALSAPDARPARAVVKLVLYMSSHSRSSCRALATVQRLTRAHGESVSLEVRDLTVGWMGEAAQDHIVFTPTLLRVWPEPRVRLVGDAATDGPLRGLLAESGLEPTRDART